MKILFLTLFKSQNIITSFSNWIKDLSKFSEIDIRARNIDKQFPSFPAYAKKVMDNPSSRPTPIIRDTKKRVFHPLIKLENVNNNYDYVVTDLSYGFLTEEWDKIKIPKIMIIEDSCNGIPERQIECAIDQKFDIVFYRYKQEFLKYQKKYIDKFACCKWLPNSINLEMFKDYGLDKEYDVTMTGYHFPPYYMYRDLAFEILEDKEYFKELKHLGYFTKGSVYGEDYAKFLNRSKISVTGGMVYNRVVMKFLEIPATRCLLVSNMFGDLKEMGFKDGENMIVADYDNLDRQMRNLLEDDEMRNEITNNGYNFVRKYHSGEVRAKQFIEELENGCQK